MLADTHIDNQVYFTLWGILKTYIQKENTSLRSVLKNRLNKHNEKTKNSPSLLSVTSTSHHDLATCLKVRLKTNIALVLNSATYMFYFL